MNEKSKAVDIQTKSHTVNNSPQSKFIGGLSW